MQLAPVGVRCTTICSNLVRLELIVLIIQEGLTLSQMRFYLGLTLRELFGFMPYKIIYRRERSLRSFSTVIFLLLIFSPNHLINHARVGLNDLYNLGGYVLLNIVGHGDAVVTDLVHGYRRIYSLQKSLFVDA